MSKSELFDILNEQFVDHLVKFDTRHKVFLSSLIEIKEEEMGVIWSDFARDCATTLDQIATASRLERYEYQETLSENINSLKENPQALEIVLKSRDQSILLEFFARILSLLYYETILEGLFATPRNESVIQCHITQSQELAELIMFSLGKELKFTEEFLEILSSVGNVISSSNILERFEPIDEDMNISCKEFLLEKKVKNLQDKGILYKNTYSKILAIAKEEFWWEDHILSYYLYSKAERYFSEAQEILMQNPLDPALLMIIDAEIAICTAHSKLALGEYYLELGLHALVKERHRQAYDYLMRANKQFNGGLTKLKPNKLSDSFPLPELIEQIELNIEFTKIFLILLELSCSIIEICSDDLSTKELKARINSLLSLSENPPANMDFHHQSEFINAVGFIFEKLRILSEHETLSTQRIREEFMKGFRRLGSIFKGRIADSSRELLQLPWGSEQQDLEIKIAICESEANKIQNIIMSVLLLPPFVKDKEKLIAKSRVVLSIANSELYHLKGLKEANATKALCLFVKSYLASKESFENIEKGEVLTDLGVFVKEEFSRFFIKSHLKEASILQTGNQYFFARRLLQAIPDALGSNLHNTPLEIAKLLIEQQSSMFDSMIAIWERLTAHYNALLDHKEKYPSPSSEILNWFYIEKKREHTRGATLFFKSCQSAIQAQKYAIIKERVTAERLFSEADKNATEAAKIFNSVIDTLKSEMQQLPKDLYNFASFCRTQSQKVSQGKKIDAIPIRDFVVLIGVISASL